MLSPDGPQVVDALLGQSLVGKEAQGREPLRLGIPPEFWVHALVALGFVWDKITRTRARGALANVGDGILFFALGDERGGCVIGSCHAVGKRIKHGHVRQRVELLQLGNDVLHCVAV